MLINRDVRARLQDSDAGSGTSTRAQSEITIGIVNIMPPMAMRRTERQFTHLLNPISHRGKIHLKFFTIPDLYPNNIAAFQLDHDHEDIEMLWDTGLDGLIVTGTEPQAVSMVDEASWQVLAKLVDWAADNTISTIWSCFAAHAAVFRLDGLRRLPFAEKLSGVFECAKVAEHQIVAAAPSRWLVPHSRYNTLSEEDLHENGYRVLSRSDRIGPDIFVKQCEKSEFVFLQGHPEYDADTLYNEYCRDIKRFLIGHRTIYPNMPEGYFDEAAIATFAALQGNSHLPSSLGDLAGLNGSTSLALKHRWREPARQLYSGWLSYIASQKMQSRARKRVPHIERAGE